MLLEFQPKSGSAFSENETGRKYIALLSQNVIVMEFAICPTLLRQPTKTWKWIAAHNSSPVVFLVDIFLHPSVCN